MSEVDPQVSAEPIEIAPEYEVYAWARLARFLDVRRHAVDNTDGDITYVDLCSSFPLYPEILRSRHAESLFHEVRRAGASLQEDILNPRAFPSVHTLFSSPERQRISHGMFKRPVNDAGNSLRQQLISVVYNSLEEVCTARPDGKDGPRLIDSIRERMYTERSVTTRSEVSDEDLEARWQLKRDFTPTDKPLAQTIADLFVPTERGVLDDGRTRRTEIPITQVGEERAAAIVEDLSQFFAKKLSGLVRPYRAVSVDMADPEILRAAAYHGFDENITSTSMFKRALEMNDHVQDDLMSFLVKQPSETVTLYTCFEGYPIYFGITPEMSETEIEEHTEMMKQILSEMFRTLVPGGVALMFPWQVLPESKENDLLLKKLTLHIKELGAEAEERLYHREEVLFWMTDKEREIALQRSPILQSGEEIITMLKFSKPKSLAYYSWAGKLPLQGVIDL